MTAFTDQQRLNAQTIIRVGTRLGASRRDILIGLMTAMQESELINIDYGDKAGPDSRGLFQQRDSWGTLADRMNPEKAAEKFFLGARDTDGSGYHLPGLLDIKNRDNMMLTAAAQKVQGSAYPNAYAKHEKAALELLGVSPVAKKNLTPPTPVPLPQAAGGAAPAAPPAPIPMPAAASKAPGLAAPVTYIDTAPKPPEPLAGLAAPGAVGATPAAPAGVGAVGAPVGLAGVGAPGDDYAPPAEFEVADQATFQQDYLGPKFAKFGTGGYLAPGRGADLITSALSYLGTPYVWGGNGREGLDCSGLVQQVYRSIGIELPRVSSDQANSGEHIALTDLKPGDLVAWDNSPRNAGADHIAIYAGNGEVIEAPRPGINVRRRKLDDYDANAFGVRLSKGN